MPVDATCSMPVSPVADPLVEFRDRTLRERTPVTGAIELTTACNLRCAFCYNGCPARPESIPADRLEDLLVEVRDAGCLFLLLTGGEPLVHPAFRNALRRTRELGMFPVLFTNGTLVDPPTATFIREYAPLAVEVSIYGARPETYDRVTGAPGAYMRFRAGLDCLLAAGVRVRLKTTLNRFSVDEVPQMEAFAAQVGASFRLDPCLFNGMDGDAVGARLRVPAQRAVELEFADPQRAAEWRAFYAAHRLDPVTERLYNCGAGIKAFHITAGLSLQPCVMVRQPAESLAGCRFETAWRALTVRVDALRAPDGMRCRGCPLKSLCSYCPGFFDLESGDATVPTGYLCELGRERLSRIVEMEAQRGDK